MQTTTVIAPTAQPQAVVIPPANHARMNVSATRGLGKLLVSFSQYQGLKN